MNHKESKVKADEVEESDERKKDCSGSVHYLDDIHQSDRRGKKQERWREERRGGFLHLHMPLLLYEVSLLAHIGFFFLALFLTVVWVRALLAFITFVNR